MEKILVITGTRPEIIKMSPIIAQARMDDEIELIHADSSQHYDYNMNKQFLEELNLPVPKYILKLDRTNSITQFSSMLAEIASLIKKIEPDIVLGQGDTNTVMLSAITAKHLNYPFGHVEAGIRSFDLNMPEEINRRVADLCANIHFCPTHLSGLNLVFEGINPSNIFITGNTIVDAVNNIYDTVLKNKKLVAKRYFSSNFSKKALLTLHRPTNVDDSQQLFKILRALKKLPDYQFIFPVHPRTRKSIEKLNQTHKLNKLENFVLIDPLGYVDFISLLLSVNLVITDSGGVQEECFCLGTKCLTIRNNTERPETIISGYNRLVDVNEQKIISSVIEMSNCKNVSSKSNILGDGTSAKRIIDIIKNFTEKDIRFISPKMHSWQNYQYRQHEITNKDILDDYEKKNKAKVLITFDQKGNPHIPEKNLLLEEGYRVITIGIFG